jgi:hypothetical protein
MVHPNLGERYAKLEHDADDIRALGYEITITIRRLNWVKV